MVPTQGLGLVVDRLACPICQDALTMTASALSCTAGHSFDIARQGYVCLFDGRSRANTGDTAAMVAARERFLGTGHYLPVARAVSDAVTPEAAGLCVDLAGGTGYYLATVVDTHVDLVGLNLELSIPALRRAARAHDRVAAVATDVWQRLPLRSAVAGYVLSVFGPRNMPEIRRVLAADGSLILITPTVRHLGELVERLGLVTVDPRKQQRIDEQLRGWVRVFEQGIEYTVDMSRRAVLDAVLMGPSAHHVDLAELTANADALPEPMTVTISLTVTVVSPAQAVR